MKLKSDGVGTEGGIVPLLSEESWLLGDLQCTCRCISVHRATKKNISHEDCTFILIPIS